VCWQDEKARKKAEEEASAKKKAEEKAAAKKKAEEVKYICMLVHATSTETVTVDRHRLACARQQGNPLLLVP